MCSILTSGGTEQKSASERTFEERLADFQSQSDSILADFLRKDYLAFFADILCYMSKDAADELLLEMNQDMRQKISHLMESRQGGSIENVRSAFIAQEFSGIKELTELERQRRRQVTINEDKFDAFCQKNPIFADTLKKLHFNFSELLSLDDRAIQKVLREIDESELVSALVHADDAIRQKVFANMSSRAAESLKEAIHYYSFIPRNDSVRAQDKIRSVILRLENSGEIYISNDYFESAIDNLLANNGSAV